MKSNALRLLFIAFPLCLGTLIYATTRSDDIALNQWIAFPGLYPLKVRLSDFFSLSSLPHWISYSLPDGLWMMALIICILLIWNLKLDKKSIPWLSIAALLGMGFEICQRFHWLKGSFDWMDIWLILAGACVPISFLLIKFHFQKYLYAKSH